MMRRNLGAGDDRDEPRGADTVGKQLGLALVMIDRLKQKLWSQGPTWMSPLLACHLPSLVSISTMLEDFRCP